MKRSLCRGLSTAAVLAASLHVIVGAQGTGQNINVITGSSDQFIGDMFRQRQNEGVIGIMGVQPADMMVAYNDYRTVDIADDQGVGTPSPRQTFVARLLNFLRAPWRLGRSDPPKELKAAAHAWIGLSFTNNGGKTWYSGLHPGRFAPEHSVPIPPDTDPALDDAHELADFDAASDPVLATTHDQFMLGGIAFQSRDGLGRSIGFFSRFTDRNDAEHGQRVHFDGTKVVLRTDSNMSFVDKPSIAAGPEGHVYMAFVVFDQSDPQKISSQILFFSSSDHGANWSNPIVVSQPLTRNQAPWILVDPRNEETVYIGWRVFSSQAGGFTNAIVGRRSFDGGKTFSPSVPFPVALLLKAFDQPQGNLAGPNPTLPSPRSNAYPTATIDGDGAIHVAIQEYVYPSNYSIALLRGRPLSPTASPTIGVPRITVTTSYNRGETWTLRKAADLGTGTSPAGTQFMPVLTAAGEPGPSCPNRTGPRSRVMLMYYDARAGGVGRTPGTLGYVSGGDKQFDVRIAQASACSTNGLNFSPSEQASQYKRNAESPFNIVRESGKTTTGQDLTSVNRAYSMFCGGNCAFSGDYIHLVPRVPYVLTRSGKWKPTTAVTDPLDREKLPAPVAQLVWADTRDAFAPTVGDVRTLPNTVDSLPWNVYGPPGTGYASCINAGARDQNIYTAEYTPGGLFASGPTTFRTSALPRSYPLFVENRTPNRKHYRLTIDPAANASFDFTDFVGPLDATPNVDPHPNFGEPFARVSNISIGAISSVTGTVVIGPNVTTPVLITIEETTAPVVDQNGQTTAGGEVIPPPKGARTTVTLNTAGADESDTETYQPVLHPTPIVTKPLDGVIPSGGLVLQTSPATIPSPTPFSPNPVEPTPFSPNPFSPNPFSPNPFSPNPFSPNPFSPNPFSPNPFSPNPFSPNAFPDGEVTVKDVTDVSFVTTNAGEQTAAFNALTDVRNAKGVHVFQVLINRAVPAPVLIPDGNGNCRVADSWQAVPISTIPNPFSPNPFSPNPFSPNPFSPNPFSPNPFSPNPFPSEFSNSTFYVQPSGDATSAQLAVSALTNGPGFVAEPAKDFVVITIRDWLLESPPGQPEGEPIRADDVEIEVVAQVPEQPVAGGGFRGDPPRTGTQVAERLAFIEQPSNTSPGVPITPAIMVAVQDTFGNTVVESTAEITIAIGNNPSDGVLSGTLTRTAVSGVATFDNLSINQVGEGYTLVATSFGLASATSDPFRIFGEPLDIVTLALPDATQGQPYSQDVFASGGVPPYVWDIKPVPTPEQAPDAEPFTLPDGLTLTTLENGAGRISGTPASVQTRSFRLRVKDAQGQETTQDLCIHVTESGVGPLVATQTAASAAALQLQGEGVEVIAESIRFSGVPAALGSFSGGFNSVGLTSGIVLSSGSVAGINPPNDQPSFTVSNGQPGDPELDALIPGFTTFDRAVLEFEFTVVDPNATTVKFDYVFASEEYNEYVNTNFNDVFAFFLQPAATPPAANLPEHNFARIPGTETPVSINNVNNGNPAGDPTPHNPEFFRDNTSGTLATQADGLTKVLSIQATVTPGQRYRLKIAIADAGDTVLDSWVLIKAGSLTVVCPIIPNCPTCGQ